MGDLEVGIIAGVVSTLIAGGIVLTARGVSRVMRMRMRPIGVSCERRVKDEWSVAFSGGMPRAARKIEGGDHHAREVYDWLLTHRAVDVGDTRLRLTLRGLADDLVVVRDIRIDARQSPPLSGTNVTCPTAGANSATLLLFDLEDPSSGAWECREDGGRQIVGDASFFENHNVSLGKGEVHDFIILGQTFASLVEWRMYVDIEVAGRRKTIIVDDSGKPFRTTGTPLGGFAETLDWEWWEDRCFRPRPGR